MKGALFALVLAACCPPEAVKTPNTPSRPPAPTTPAPIAPAPPVDTKDLAVPNEVHLRNVHQVTFGGNNAEAYWAFGGDKLILQTDHAPYKCDQIEVQPLRGPGTLVSTGKGRTTCSYFLQGDKEIIYASTHEVSPDCPTPPDMSKGYTWGLFEYDIYRANADGSNLRRLTNEPGYDAEATVCAKDGSIIFTSMRSGDLELWRMDADGKKPRQITNSPGYDGGAFFSADCSKIVWRASRPAAGPELDEYKALLAQKLVKPTKMDLYVANADGSDARQVTYLPGASFAPFFFPNGKRIIFASNYVNPRSGDFDLYAIDTDGAHLERITFAPGFDGFPMFSPDGKTLAFSSNRRDVTSTPAGDVYRLTGKPAGERDTNVFVAEWVDTPDAKQPVASETEAADRFAANVAYLADDVREGRGVGTKGLDDATAYVMAQLESVGIAPGVPGWKQTFEVTTEQKRGAATALAVDGTALADADFAPMPISASATATGQVVEAGWGVVDAKLKLDDYQDKAVASKVVLVHRFTAPDLKLSPGDANRLGDLRFKAYIAKQKGAVALLVVDDGDPKADEVALPKLDAVQSVSGIPVVVLTRKAGAALRGATHTVKLTVKLEPVRTKTSNVVGVIKSGAPTKLPGVLVVGAHLDHLGMGGPPSALDPNVHAVHNGADDNASGVAALLEVARTLAAKKQELARDVYIVAFSAEEMGTLGSEWYVKHLPVKAPIAAMLNMDMVGRMRMSKLHVNGGDSAKEWKAIVGPACEAAHIDCTIGGSGYGPSDHMPFYIAGVPVLFMFTGSHREYHTATDDADKINAVGGAKVAQIVSDVALALGKRADKLTYVKAPPEQVAGDVRRRGASLGTVPSYSEDPSAPRGMVLADVVPEGPAAKAGLRAGDRITAVGTAEISSVADLMYVLEAAKPGTDVVVTFVRDGKAQQLTVTYGVPKGRR